MFWAPTVYQTLDFTCVFWSTFHKEPVRLGLLTLFCDEETGWERFKNSPRVTF